LFIFAQLYISMGVELSFRRRKKSIFKKISHIKKILERFSSHIEHIQSNSAIYKGVTTNQSQTHVTCTITTHETSYSSFTHIFYIRVHIHVWTCILGNKEAPLLTQYRFINTDDCGCIYGCAGNRIAIDI